MSRIVFYFIGICFIHALTSCHEIEEKIILKPQHTGQNISCIQSLEVDSSTLEKIKTDIHADEKAFQIDTFFNAKIKNSHFNGCILVAQKGVVLYNKSIGVTTFKKNESDSLTADTKFQLASLSKTFTAVATLKLIEEKKLSLDDSVQKFFPLFPYKNITIQLLLSHRSGLPYYAYVFEDSLYKTTRPKNADIIRWFEIVKPDPYGYPDRSFAYNNSNYMLLALIIEKVSGKTYAQYIRENICAPLDMNDTYVYEGEDKPIPGPITKGHEGRRVVPIDFFDEVVGDKGVYSTLNDLYKWHKALRSECLLKKETLRLAFTPTSFEHKGIRNYGLGFRMILEKDEKTPKYIYHNGWWKGYNSLFWFCPKTQSIIIILTNVRNKSIYRIKPLLSILEEEQQESESTEEEMGGE